MIIISLTDYVIYHSCFRNNNRSISDLSLSLLPKLDAHSHTWCLSAVMTFLVCFHRDKLRLILSNWTSSAILSTARRMFSHLLHLPFISSIYDIWDFKSCDVHQIFRNASWNPHPQTDISARTCDYFADQQIGWPGLCQWNIKAKERLIGHPWSKLLYGS